MRTVKEILSHQARKAARARWLNTPMKRRTEIAKAAWQTRRKNLQAALRGNGVTPAD